MTLKDIANLAGVSPTTVSMVLNSKGNVGKDTRDRVSKLLIENGYIIRTIRKEPKRKGIRFLKYSRSEWENAYLVSTISDAIERESKQLGFDLEVVECNNIAEVADICRMDLYNGIILLGTELQENDLAYFTDIKTPLIVTDNPMDRQDISSVSTNNLKGIRLAVDYLYKQGQRKIGYLCQEVPNGNCRAREIAYKTVLKEYGLDPIVYQMSPTFSVQDHEISQKIPLIGFDDILYMVPVPKELPLTMIQVPCYDLGAWAVRLLANRLIYSCSSTAKIQLSPMIKNNPALEV